MLLLRVVSTQGVWKNVCLSVHFSAVPRSGGQHPRPLGVTLTPPTRTTFHTSLRHSTTAINRLTHAIIPYYIPVDGRR